jgi:hypothetical protein
MDYATLQKPACRSAFYRSSALKKVGYGRKMKDEEVMDLKNLFTPPNKRINDK